MTEAMEFWNLIAAIGQLMKKSPWLNDSEIAGVSNIILHQERLADGPIPMCGLPALRDNLIEGYRQNEILERYPVRGSNV